MPKQHELMLGYLS